MKNIGITLIMFLFVGVGTSLAQDKKADDAATTTKTEVKAEGHACKPGCKMACCAGKTAADKKSCSHAEKKQCSHAAAVSGDAKTEEDSNTAPR